MSNQRSGILLRFLFYCIPSFIVIKASGSPVQITPEPVEISPGKGVFHFNEKTRIYLTHADTGALMVVKRFTVAFRAASGISLPLIQSASGNPENVLIISIKPDPQIKNKEGYIIDISDKKINLVAPDAAGLFYAFESLKQLLPAGFYSKSASQGSNWTAPAVHILDYPRFAYRGMHLDVSRHFFPTSFIKKYLDLLARYKINTFHWHLTDSHGWRLEIKQYPKLTAVGAWRADRKDIPMIDAKPTGRDEPATYGGYYTQQEVKEIIQYAKDRFITIIPEIEMPGHCEAALVSYPQYNCLNNPVPLLMPCGYAGDLEHNFCVGNDSTFIFLNNILTEVMQLFPSSYIHIGGDEVRTRPWESCPRCIARMKEQGFGNPRQLQAYFTHRIDSFVTSKGKKTIGWDEILEADLAPGSAAMSWHDEEGSRKDLKHGHDVVMTPYHYTYFDFYQSDPALEPDTTYARLQLDTVYAFDPVLPGLAPEEAALIPGGQACLWTENVPTPARVEYMLLPRLLALSEALWSPRERKSYRKFIDKTETQFRRWDAEKINYAKSLYNVSIVPEKDTVNKTVSVKLEDQTAGKYSIRFTTNGANPDAGSQLYTGPLTLKKGVLLKAALFNQNKILGKINEYKNSE